MDWLKNKCAIVEKKMLQIDLRNVMMTLLALGYIRKEIHLKMLSTSKYDGNLGKIKTPGILGNIT